MPTEQCSRMHMHMGHIGAILVALMLSSCNDQRWDVPDSFLAAPDGKKALNVRDVVVNLPDDATQAFAQWRSTTGTFGDSYTEEILRIGKADEPQTIARLKEFVAHPDVAPIESAIDSTFGPNSNLSEYESRLTNGLDRFAYFMPRESTPQIAWMNSGFNFAVYPTPTHLSVGLEWFLGTENPITQTLPPRLFPQYMREKMIPSRLPATALRGWLLVHFSERFYDTSNCANELLYWGKIMFLLQKCLPEESTNNLLDWSTEDLLWAEKNERAIWMELQPQSMLFSSNRMEFGRWYDEGPFTRVGGIPQEGPDRLGAWMGLQMVQDFMDDHPDWTMEDLMNSRDPMPIIKSYRPG